MVKALEIAVVLSAVDRMSQVFNSAVDASSAKLKGLQDQFKSDFKTGSMLTAAGTSLAFALSPAIEAYAKLEDSSTAMKASMLEDGSIVSEHFAKVNELAIELGNRLPGTTADFQDMFTAMKQGGIEQKAIIDGVGKAGAYLAVGLKVPYLEAGTLTAKLKESLGVVSKDMLEFMDLMSRGRNVGVQPTEMTYAFARQAGALKNMKLQGLEAAKSAFVVNAMLIKNGQTGETVGTGMTAIYNQLFDSRKMARFNNEAAKLGMHFEFIDKKTGEFKGIENMMAQFDRLKNLNPQQRADIVRAFLGPGQDANFMNILITQGVKGYNEMSNQFARQATLNAKVEMQLQTLKNVWEAATGTFENMLASFGKALGPELKIVIDLLTKISVWIQAFADAHPRIFKAIGIFIALTSVLLVVVGVFFLLKAAILIVWAVLMANPFVLIAIAVIAVVSVIIAYWSSIGNFFVRLWNLVKSSFISAWGVITSMFKGFVRFIFQWGQVILGPMLYIPILIIQNWAVISTFFSRLWAGIKAVFFGFVKWFIGLHIKFFEAGKNIVLSIWNGIKSIASKPIEAIKAIVQKMRDFLPFSPAKTGPFKDLHRVKIVETIAQTMKPAPLLKAMRAAAVSITSPSAFAGLHSPGGGAYSQSGGAVYLTYSPTITISGGASSEDRTSFAEELNKHKNELTRMIDEIFDRRKRTSF